jgi:acyl carrier protein
MGLFFEDRKYLTAFEPFERGVKVKMDDIKEELRQYILTEFLPGEKLSNLHDDTPLRTSGIVDSIGMLRLVTFIEQRFGIEVDAYDASVENFNRIADMAAFIQRKRGAGA